MPFGEVLPVFTVFPAVPHVVVPVAAIIHTRSDRHPDAHLGAGAGQAHHGWGGECCGEYQRWESEKHRIGLLAGILVDERA
jgi:hypothetical protein